MKIEEIIPLNGHVYVEPVEKKQILVADSGRLETFGRVIAIPKVFEGSYMGEEKYANSYHGIQVGDYVAFELWDIKDLSTNDKKYYLIRAEEVICKVRVSGELVA